MKILALIPARGESKRVPGKNKRMLGGKPLIAWSIDAAKPIPEICDILVSTDDPDIAAIARDAGAMVPWLRPVEIATDTASSVDVALHALDWYEGKKGEVDGLLLLQPTSPFRRAETIAQGIGIFRRNNQHSVVAFSPAKSHPMWCFRVEGMAIKPFMENENGLSFRSQELPPAYVINGAFYLFTPNELRQHRSFYNDTSLPLIIDSPEESVDIDTEWDWRMAETILAMKEAYHLQ